MRYAVTIQYLGTNYCGWQNQKNGISVQGVLEKAFLKLFKGEVAVFGSGRTDAGVHALGQVAHFDTDSKIPADKIPFAVNTLLPNDIRVVGCKVVANDFHARFNAIQKTYVYRLYVSPHINPLKMHIAEHITGTLDIDNMVKASSYIEGTHDFKCFLASGSNVKSTVRTVSKIDIDCKNEDISISVSGDGFLYNMVRIIAGTLVDVGKGKIKADDIPNIILSKNRTLAGKTLQAKGLCLKEVKY